MLKFGWVTIQLHLSTETIQVYVSTEGRVMGGGGEEEQKGGEV